MLAIVSVALLQASGSPETAPRLDEVGSWSKFEAADRLLAAEDATAIIDGQFRSGMAASFYSGRWWGRAEPTAGFQCSRAAHYVSLRPLDVRSPTSPMQSDHRASTQFASTYPQAATPETCATLTGWINTTPDDRQAKLLGLERLIEAIRLASTDQPLPFEIACESTSTRPCGDARTALKELPISALYEVEPVIERYRSEPVVNGVQVRYAIPPADGVYSAFEAKFGPSRTYDSWFVTLQGRNQLDRVTIRRASVIYH